MALVSRRGWCYPPGMLQRVLFLVSVLWLAGSASLVRADDAVQCDRLRDACDAQILELCPAGADVLDEQEVPGPSPQVRRYRIIFRCRGAAGEVAPAAVAAPAAAAPAAAPGQPAAAPAGPQPELEDVNVRLAEL